MKFVGKALRSGAVDPSRAAAEPAKLGVYNRAVRSWTMGPLVLALAVIAFILVALYGFFSARFLAEQNVGGVASPARAERSPG